MVLRGRRSTGHEEREIDKAHVLRAAESPWLEVSTVGLSCRLLIAGTMQQMALIAIPTRSSHSRILLCSSYLSLSLSSSRLSRYFALLSSLLRCFSHIFPRGSSPPPPPSIRSDISRDSMCSISYRRQACHLRAPWRSHPGHYSSLIGCTLERWRVTARSTRPFFNSSVGDAFHAAVPSFSEVELRSTEVTETAGSRLLRNVTASADNN